MKMHRYFSTACFHEVHDYCSAMTGLQGIKRPAQCKFCSAPCICPCHGLHIQQDDGIDPSRPTTD